MKQPLHTVKHLLLTLAVGTTTILSALSHTYAGAKDGGGGIGSVCRDSANKITKATLADITAFEINNGVTLQRVLPSGNAASDEATVTALMKEATDKIDAAYPSVGNAILVVSQHIRTQSKYYPSGVSMKAQPDLGSDPIPYSSNCPLEHIGYYTSGQLFVVSDIINALSLTDRAMFWLHEGSYKMYRKVLDIHDSSNVRKLIGSMAFGKVPNMNYVDIDGVVKLGLADLAYMDDYSAKRGPLTIEVKSTTPGTEKKQLKVAGAFSKIYQGEVYSLPGIYSPIHYTYLSYEIWDRVWSNLGKESGVGAVKFTVDEARLADLTQDGVTTMLNLSLKPSKIASSRQGLLVTITREGKVLYSGFPFRLVKVRYPGQDSSENIARIQPISDLLN